jgi:hypothetical protein
MEPDAPRVITLPNSKAEIKFLKSYKRERLVDLTRRLIVEEDLAVRMRESPTEELRKLGIVITEEDRRRITDEDILIALGHRAPAGEEVALGPVAVVIVIVAVVNAPGPAY